MVGQTGVPFGIIDVQVLPISAAELNGQSGSYYRNAANLTGAAQLSGSFTGSFAGTASNADLLDNLDSSYFRNGANITGTASLNINGTVGATIPTSGAFTALSASSTVTLSNLNTNAALVLDSGKNISGVAPGSSGNVLTSNGTGWSSLAPAGGGSLILLQTVSASSSATVDLENSVGGTYDNYLITFTNVRPTDSSVYLQARLKISNQYQTSFYSQVVSFTSSSASTFTPERTSNESSFYVSRSDVGSAPWNGAHGQFWFSSPSNTSIYKLTNWSTSNSNSTNAGWSSGGGFCWSGTEALTGIRFFFTTGYIASGVFRLYGIKNS
jgi:hypothetical protein